MELLAILTKLAKLPEQDLTPALNLFEPINVPAGKALLSPGEVCSQIWFVGTGSLRAYYYLEERKRTKKGESNEKATREVTDWLIPAGGLLTDMRSFSQQAPSSYYVEALEACQLHRLSHQKYGAILKSHPVLVAKIFEQAFGMVELRMKICNFRSAEDRLRMFELAYQGKTSHFSVNTQASFLNIDPSTLSRWRAKRR